MDESRSYLELLGVSRPNSLIVHLQLSLTMTPDEAAAALAQIQKLPELNANRFASPEAARVRPPSWSGN